MSDFYVIVAGMGRCGTSLVFSSIAEKLEDRSFVKHIENYSFENGGVYKTHDLPPLNLSGNPKVIFMFGNPMNIAVSADNVDKESRRNDNYEWSYAHYNHLHADVSKKDLFHKEDTLGLEKQFDLWCKPQTFPLLTVRYETMFYNLHTIKEFLGISDINFPEKIPRKTNWKEHIFKEDLEKTYKALNEKIILAPDIKKWDISNE